MIEEVARLAGAERRATARLVAALAELDARRLYLAQGCSSLFAYCTRVLHLSEHAAYGRIEAARTGRRIPIVLERARALMRHTNPDGDLATIFRRVLGSLVADLEKGRFAATSRPRASASACASGRQIPAAVRREVWKRDDGRCAFVGASGRCGETGFLEFHHVCPFAAGGASTTGNLELRCRAHNRYESEQFFGPLIAREDRQSFDVHSV